HTLLQNGETLAAEAAANRRPDDAEPSLDDLPPRFANLLLLAVAGDRISLGSAAQITGVDPGGLEQAFARTEAQRDSVGDEGGIDDRDPRGAWSAHPRPPVTWPSPTVPMSSFLWPVLMSLASWRTPMIHTART